MRDSLLFAAVQWMIATEALALESIRSEIIQEIYKVLY